jgi:predicted site-specific integrase-resolvase
MRLKDLEGWLTPAEAGRLIGLSKQGVNNYLKDGYLRGVKTTQGWLVDPEDARRVRDARRGQR